MAKTCMITGHREVPIGKIDYVKAQLQTEVTKAINKGYTHFISGFARGVDLYFAEIIVELKTFHDITLEAAIPYRERLNTKDKNFQQLLRHCDTVDIHSEEYASSVFMKRNRYMVQQSELVIAVYDGRGKSGTFATMQYAYKLGKNVIIIPT